MIERLVMMTRIGFTSGTVTFQNTSHACAPSTSAASTSSCGTCESAA